VPAAALPSIACLCPVTSLTTADVIDPGYLQTGSRRRSVKWRATLTGSSATWTITLPIRPPVSFLPPAVEVPGAAGAGGGVGAGGGGVGAGAGGGAGPQVAAGLA